ncbi:hypothetical protein [[Eubacterium] cellulosolvens]
MDLRKKHLFYQRNYLKVLFFTLSFLLLTSPIASTTAGRGHLDYTGIPTTSLQRNLDAYGQGPFCASCHSLSYPQPPEELFIETKSPKLYGALNMEPGLKRLTEDPGRDIGAIYSPFSNKIVWVTDRLGYWTIWVMNGDGTKKRQLTSENLISGWPSWSPNGSELAYWSWDPVTNKSDIWKMKVDGSLKTQLTEDGSFKGPPKWSPKGDRIAYTGNLTGNMEIYLINSDGSDNKQLTKDHNPNYWVESRVTWHPDGQRLYYQVTTFPLPENVKTKIINDVAFVEIHVINVDTDYDKNLTPELHENVRCVSPDGEKLACISLRSPNYGLWVMDDDGSNQTPLTWDSSRILVQPHLENPLISNVGDRAPMISPDGKKIVYWSLESNNQPDIWMINIDGTNKTKLTSNLFQDVYPSWSSDGKKIIFESDRTGNFDIWYLKLNQAINVDLKFKESPIPGSIGYALITITPLELGKNQVVIESVSMHFDWNDPNEFQTHVLRSPYTFSGLNDSFKLNMEFAIPENASLGYHFYDITVQFTEYDLATYIAGCCPDTPISIYEHSAGDLEIGSYEQQQSNKLRTEIESELELLYEREINKSRDLGDYPSESPEPLTGYFDFLTQPESEFYVSANDEFYKAKNTFRVRDFDEALSEFQNVKKILDETEIGTPIWQNSNFLYVISVCFLIIIGITLIRQIQNHNNNFTNLGKRKRR